MTNRKYVPIKKKKKTTFCFDDARLVSLVVINDDEPGENKTIHCQTIAMSLFEALGNAKTLYGRNLRLNSWSSRCLPGKDGSCLYGGGEYVPGRLDRFYPEELAAINP